jgi:ferrous iron transport protein B
MRGIDIQLLGERMENKLIGLVGNQNAGKTTLFNALTGMNATVGNWPGVTIERKEGLIKGSKDALIGGYAGGLFPFSLYG